MSTKAKVITGLIYATAAILLIAVVYLNLHPDFSFRKESAEETTTVPAAVTETTTEPPYNINGSDKYADIEPIYKVSEVSVEKDGHDVWSAFVDGKKAEDYTGVAKNDHGWWFVRDGEVDYLYNGIAGNEYGNWYIVKGKVDFSYTGTYTTPGSHTAYRVVEGQVVED